VKFLFMPVSIILGIVAGLIGRKLFEQAWGLIDDEEPPDAEHREIDYPKLVAALAIEGAIFRLVRGLTDHGARVGFARVMGTWPGEEAPEPE
jgi:Protein of unknown function (DUF4235)